MQLTIDNFVKYELFTSSKVMILLCFFLSLPWGNQSHSVKCRNLSIFYFKNPKSCIDFAFAKLYIVQWMVTWPDTEDHVWTLNRTCGQNDQQLFHIQRAYSIVFLCADKKIMFRKIFGYQARAKRGLFTN